MIGLGRASFNGSGLVPAELTITVEMEDVTSALPRPDKGWSYTDRAGHFHAYSVARDGGSYPTLFEVLQPCDLLSTEGHDDLEWCGCRWVFQCRICSEVIEPGTVVDTHREMRPGHKDWFVTLKNLDPLPQVGTLGVVRFGRYFGVAVVIGAARSSSAGDTRVDLRAAGALGEVAK